jgi:1-acyl-sn-glycerol-3-phosphate acyltransferase
VAWLGLLAPVGALAAIIDVLAIRLVIVVVWLVGTVALLALTVIETRIGTQGRLIIAPTHVSDVDPYEIGVQREATEPSGRVRK